MLIITFMDGFSLLRLRRRARLTQFELGRLAGVAAHTVGRIERGEVEPELTTVRRLATALGVPLSELVSGLDATTVPEILDRSA